MWLSQLTIAVPSRGSGYGTATMLAVHARLVDMGIEELWLRVFDWNVAARRLYDRLGYRVARRFVADAHLFKRLDAPQV
jgi:RimJ/RimL family protein N-acetyltransferase